MHQPITPSYLLLAADLVKWYFPFQPEPTHTASGVWIIGHGHSRTTYRSMTLSQGQAHELLLADLEICDKMISSHLPAKVYDQLTSSELATLISLTMLEGSSLLTHDLFRLLSRGWKDQVPAQISRLYQGKYPRILSLWYREHKRAS